LLGVKLLVHIIMEGGGPSGRRKWNT